MTKKGKRNLILEMNSKQFAIKDLEKFMYLELKKLGVKYAEDVNIYLNTKEGIAYCVTENKTYRIKIG